MTDKQEKDTKRFSFLVTDEEKIRWKNFIAQHELSTISKLLRESLEFYIKNYSTIQFFKSFPKKIHDLKEPLTNIKAICEILLKERKNEIEWENLLYIKDISDQTEILQEKLINLNYENIGIINDIDVLIIDDDLLTIKILINFIEDHGYSCKKAVNGKEALEKLNKFRPKLILLDVLLPDTTGYEICKKIKSNHELKNIPIYYLTAVTASEVAEQTKKTAADGFILKPFKLDEIQQLFHLIK